MKPAVLLDAQQQVRTRQEKAQRKEELRLVYADLLNIKRRCEALELTAQRCGYPGNANLLALMMNEWLEHIEQNHHIGGTRPGVWIR